MTSDTQSRGYSKMHLEGTMYKMIICLFVSMLFLSNSSLAVTFVDGPYYMVPVHNEDQDLASSIYARFDSKNIDIDYPLTSGKKADSDLEFSSKILDSLSKDEKISTMN